ncbi:MAG: hypothetical protein HY554_12425 [Elusimicrobia bacterium]|nr:hypothetical protein [Elusimicrobiota bacterium]
MAAVLCAFGGRGVHAFEPPAIGEGECKGPCPSPSGASGSGIGLFSQPRHQPQSPADTPRARAARHYDEGWRLMREGWHARAADRFQEGLLETPEDCSLHYSLGAAIHERVDYPGAVRVWRIALEQHGCENVRESLERTEAFLRQQAAKVEQENLAQERRLAAEAAAKRERDERRATWERLGAGRVDDLLRGLSEAFKPMRDGSGPLDLGGPPADWKPELPSRFSNERGGLVDVRDIPPGEPAPLDPRVPREKPAAQAVARARRADDLLCRAQLAMFEGEPRLVALKLLREALRASPENPDLVKDAAVILYGYKVQESLGGGDSPPEPMMFALLDGIYLSGGNLSSLLAYLREDASTQPDELGRRDAYSVAMGIAYRGEIPSGRLLPPKDPAQPFFRDARTRERWEAGIAELARHRKLPDDRDHILTAVEHFREARKLDPDSFFVRDAYYRALGETLVWETTEGEKAP